MTSANSVPAVKLGNELSVSAIGFGAMASGTRRAARVEENLGSLKVTLTPEQLDALDAAGTAVSGQRYEDLTWVSAGRE
jgi:aryl-alcohol dehydrogenase-like predicted oxidoreductase